MKMKHIIVYLLTVATGVFITACTDGYEEMNRNPYGVDSKEMQREGYSLSSAMVNLSDWAIPADINTLQFTDCLGGGTMGGYLSDSNSGFNNKNFSTFVPEDGWSASLFKDIIPKVFVNVKKVSEQMIDPVTKDTINPVPIAVADIVKVLAMQRITDAYGPIPYSKIGQNGEIKAPYDTQKDIYNKMFEQLNSDIEVLTKHQTEDFSPKADHVYEGKVIKWIRLANSLKLRMAMRIVNVEPKKAKEMAESAVNHSIGVMQDNSDNAFYKQAGKNPFYVVMYEYNGGDSRVNANIITFMNGYKDPRREAMFTKSTLDGANNEYIGLRSGITIPDADVAHAYSNYNVKVNTPIMWMNASEVAFLKAEGALRGWKMGNATAKELYNKGIKLSFEQWQVSGAESYMNDSENTPASYIDPAGTYSFSKVPSDITIKWEDGNFKKSLERIITQKWIANFPLGHEAWSEFRRTGYPKLMPAVVNLSAGTVDSNRGARRMMYPKSENSNNKQNYEKALQLLGGANSQGIDVWWAKKN